MEKKKDESTAGDRLCSLWNTTHFYQNNIPYPTAKDYADVKKKDFDTFIGTQAEHKEYQSIRERYYHDLLIKAREQYHAEEQRILNLFRSDLEEYHGIIGNPKAAILWSKAWDRSHSAGLYEVWQTYQDLLDLIL